MNHWDASPNGQERRSNQGSSRDGSGDGGSSSTSSMNNQQRSCPQNRFKYLQGDGDLQKLRMSNHSSHHRNRRDMLMSDSEHDGIIKGLLFPPTLEDSAYDFYDDDLEEDGFGLDDNQIEAQYHVNLGNGEQSTRGEDIHSSSHRGVLDDQGLLADNAGSHHDPRSTSRNHHEHRLDDAYYSNFLSNMGRPTYPDTSSGKLSR